MTHDSSNWKISTRWRDFDANGHVNNATYMTYLEEARDRFFVSCGIPQDATVLARSELVYRRPIPMGVKEVECSISCERIGRSSIVTVERMTVDGDAVLDAVSTSVMVGRDDRPEPVPDRVRHKLDRHSSDPRQDGIAR
jgi:acyl-CoA thioester hydrolase